MKRVSTIGAVFDLLDADNVAGLEMHDDVGDDVLVVAGQEEQLDDPGVFEVLKYGI